MVKRGKLWAPYSSFCGLCWRPTKCRLVPDYATLPIDETGDKRLWWAAVCAMCLGATWGMRKSIRPAKHSMSVNTHHHTSRRRVAPCQPTAPVCPVTFVPGGGQGMESCFLLLLCGALGVHVGISVGLGSCSGVVCDLGVPSLRVAGHTSKWFGGYNCFVIPATAIVRLPGASRSTWRMLEVCVLLRVCVCVCVCAVLYHFYQVSRLSPYRPHWRPRVGSLTPS